MLSLYDIPLSILLLIFYVPQLPAFTCSVLSLLTFMLQGVLWWTLDLFYFISFKRFNVLDCLYIKKIKILFNLKNVQIYWFRDKLFLFWQQIGILLMAFHLHSFDFRPILHLILPNHYNSIETGLINVPIVYFIPFLYQP